MSALAALLRRLREESGLTQEELAERAGVSARTISDTERGLRVRLYADTADRLASGLGLDGSIRHSFIEVARGRYRAERGAITTLPHPLTPLVGRTEELSVLVRDLQPGARRLATVTGLGGAGKTRLAVAAAERLAPAYGGRVCFVRLVPGADPDRLVDSVASALGTAPSSVAAGVAGRPTLVVLDSFEHALPATGALGDLLGRAPELQALVTSRERVRIAGERELALGPLPPDDAAALFLDRMHDLDPQLPDDPELVAEICRLVSGLPLPLELAAAHLRYLPLDLLRDRLRAGLTDARHVVQEAVAWSVSTLSTDQGAVLAAAAMFEAGWRLDALQAVCGEVDVVGALGTLADRSLVLLDPGDPTPRWRMLDVVREIAADLEPEQRTRRTAYTKYYLRLLDDVSGKLGQERDWYRVLAAEEPNVRSALTWAERDGAATTLLTLATRMWLFWQARGGLDEGRHWLTTGLALHPPAEPGVRASALWGQAWLAYHQADDEVAEAAGRELAVLAAERGDLTTRRNALTIAGIVAIARDRPQDAVAHLTEALAIARDLDQPWILATSLLNQGLAHLALGKPDRARPALGEALSTYDKIGDERFHARCLAYLGLASLLENDPGRAGALFAQSLRTFAELAEPAGTAEGVAGIAAVAATTGQTIRAATLGGAAERLRETVAARQLPLERRATAPYLTSAEQAVGSTEWARAWRSGRQLTLTAAVSLALTEHPDLRSTHRP
ncbi:MAG TPA: helix-turn-helix domain-containing protein [Nocardioidaceae bacterium]|jgi:predicted ATPase/DNA-binding XRE family transcriptional regulator|nr:helix-turn-helix domain-containing protein [Nocardioidaceae bacterium]